MIDLQHTTKAMQEAFQAYRRFPTARNFLTLDAAQIAFHAARHPESTYTKCKTVAALTRKYLIKGNK